MNARPFLEKSNQPNDQTLQAALGSLHAAYQDLIALADSYQQAWTFTKSSGWMLKIHDRKKALFYLIPLRGGFKISLAIRPAEREALLRDDELADLHEKISSSKKYSEGFALQFDIASPQELPLLVLFMKKLIAIRG